MPNLITDYQKNATVERLKKTWSVLSQTTNRAITDNGPIDTWEVDGMSAQQFATTYLTPYLNVMKVCTSQNQEDCNFKYALLNDRNNYAVNYPNSSYHIFYLSDGTKILIYRPSVSEESSNVQIAVDINGDKGLNIYGRDVFRFIYWLEYKDSDYFKGKFIPYGAQMSRDTVINGTDYSCRKDRSGALCAALIMKDGWKISDDYPR